ncbi:hypothetical protein [Oscillatoria salina]|uniref:hypothetical protein n=1 Tax=Oscillatoria salina TaxID=331517 RepID=UPI0021E326FE|nr:hypothetical protein [Oscillatoria salina]
MELAQRAEEAIAQLEQEQQHYQKLLQHLREKGINPEQFSKKRLQKHLKLL